MKKPPKELVDAFLEWYASDPHSQKEDHYAGVVTKEHLEGLSREEFIQFFFQFAHDGGMVQSGGYRTAPMLRETVEGNYEAFREFVMEPFGDSFEEAPWLDRIHEFKGLGQGLATIYLNRVDKARFAVINNKAVEAVELFDVKVPSVLTKKYLAVRDAELQLIEWFPEFGNLYRTDALSQFLIGEPVGEKWKALLEGEKIPPRAFAAPFDRLFRSEAEAESLFDLLRRGMELLGLGPDDADDQLIACTNPSAAGRTIIRVNYSNWAVLAAIRDPDDALLFQYVCRDDLVPAGVVGDKGEGFAAEIEGHKYFLVSVPAEDATGGETAKSIEESLVGVQTGFKGRTASPYRQHHRKEIFEAIFDRAKLHELLIKGIKGNEQEQHWIIAPGKAAFLWDDCQRDGVIRVGWDELAVDLSEFDTEDKLRERYVEAYSDTSDFKGIHEFVNVMKPGDWLFVKNGMTELIGYGEVVSGYAYNASLSTYRHVRQVKWLKSGNWTLPEGMKKLPRKTLTPIPIGDVKRVKELLGVMEATKPPVSDAAFTPRAFELLSMLRAKPEVSVYNAHSKEFKELVEQPFQSLLNAVASRVRPEIKQVMETEKRIFSKIAKNDYGRGGAWDFYWGAFCPKGGKRIEDAQLFVWMHDQHIDFGFYIGEYGTDQRTRFVSNCQNMGDRVESLLAKELSELGLSYGDRGAADSNELGLAVPGLSLTDWLARVDQVGIRAGVWLERSAVLSMSAEALTQKITDTFEALFPFVFLATQDDPLGSVQRYLDQIETVGPENPAYTVETFAQETHMEPSAIQKWVRAIKRKKQLMFYGPPGTGKTYVAQRLGKHLIGGSDGFCEVLQFHPSYAYEDFIQGLRPKAMKGGGLEYAMVPGRFKDFCERARGFKGPCVLIIDEINRANLSRVFGELMYLLEYREDSVPLAGGERFQIPANAYIVGTMNTADRSIALVDHALRRRFAFLGLYPDFGVLRGFHEKTGFNPDGLVGVLERLNGAISDRHYAVGISFFLDPEIGSKVADVWEMEIEPYIEELFFDQMDKAANFRWEKVRDDILGA